MFTPRASAPDPKAARSKARGSGRSPCLVPTSRARSLTPTPPPAVAAALCVRGGAAAGGPAPGGPRGAALLRGPVLRVPGEGQGCGRAAAEVRSSRARPGRPDASLPAGWSRLLCCAANRARGPAPSRTSLYSGLSHNPEIPLLSPLTCRSMLLPYLLAGLTSGVVPDYRAATYMVVGQLASRATFTADLATGAGRGLRECMRILQLVRSACCTRCMHLAAPMLRPARRALHAGCAPPVMQRFRSRRRPSGALSANHPTVCIP